jgi:hypothetical protein
MTRNHQEWVCIIAPGCHYKVGIRIFPTARALRIALGASEAFYEGDVYAFCTSEKGDNNRLATLNFCPESLKPEIIAHEVFHATCCLVLFLRLSLEDDYAQELAAHAVSWMVEKVNECAKLSKRRSPK